MAANFLSQARLYQAPPHGSRACPPHGTPCSCMMHHEPLPKAMHGVPFHGACAPLRRHHLLWEVQLQGTAISEPSQGAHIVTIPSASPIYTAMDP